VDIDRVQASQNLHATLRPVITTLDHHEGTASTDPFCIGLGLVIGDAEVYERIKQVGALVGGVPLDRGSMGCAVLGVIKSEMHLVPCKAVRVQLLHDMFSVSERVI
jgi:hypothetical protein